MLATSAAVAGVAFLSKLLETTVAPGIRGSSFAGKPSTIFPTVAEVPGDAVGLGDAVTVEALDAGAEAPVGDVAASGAAGLQAATASMAPAAKAAQPVALILLMTVTGTFLLGLMPDASLQFSQYQPIEFPVWGLS
jgi:hypothetical protein